jgi:hypothetical protein
VRRGTKSIQEGAGGVRCLVNKCSATTGHTLAEFFTLPRGLHPDTPPLPSAPPLPPHLRSKTTPYQTEDSPPPGSAHTHLHGVCHLW